MSPVKRAITMKSSLWKLCVLAPLVSSCSGTDQAPVAQNVGIPRLVVQAGHSGTVNSVALSPDGKTAASGGFDNSIKLWDVASGLGLRTLVGHSREVKSITFSPDGSTLASGSGDATLKLWNVASGRELRTFFGHSSHVNSVAFSRNGKSLASGSQDSTVKLWDVDSGQNIRTFTGHSIEVNSVAFSPDGQTLASGSSDDTIKLWDIASGRELRTLRGNSDGVESIAFSPDGKTIVSGSRVFQVGGAPARDDTIKLWDATGGRELRTFAGHSSSVHSVVFSPDGSMIGSGSGDDTIKLWDVASGRELRTIKGHLKSVQSIAFSTDGQTLASGSSDDTVKLWRVTTAQELRTLGGHARPLYSVAVSPDGKLLALAGENTVKLWNLTSGREPRTLGGHVNTGTSVAFSRDGNWLAVASDDGTVALWDVASGRELRTFTTTYYKHLLWSVSFSPSAKMLASGSSDGTVTVWDTATGRPLRQLDGHSNGVQSVSFSPDGKTVAWAGDNTVHLWDVGSKQPPRILAGHSEAVFSIAFSADGGTLASGSGDKTVKLWDVASGRLLRTLTGNSGNVQSVSFSPDGKTLVSGGDDSSVRLWDAATGKELTVLTGHSSVVMSTAFLPDGKTVVSGSWDQTAKLWRVADGSILATLTSFGDGAWAVTDSEGRYDASNAGNNPYLHWVVGMTPITLDQLKDRYYEPGLLAKIVGYDPEALRSVPALAGALVHMFPQLQAQFDTSNPLQLLVNLRDQGGGYGKVRVRLNGKEITPDARDGKLLTGKHETVTLRLASNSLLSAENIVDVVAWNADNTLSSPAVMVKLENSRGAQPVARAHVLSSERRPLYAIVMGVANFRDPSMHLTYSGKDAYDFARAITLGADRLFGSDKVHLHLLTDYEEQGKSVAIGNVTAQRPTRANLQAAFAQIAKEAKPDDILVVFLAGHGVMSTGADGDYYYLTSDAAGLDLADPAVRKLWGVSSNELTEWIKHIHANKQMMVLDTCASGGALPKLTQQRAVSSSQIIALDRLKDRTGFYVLAGAAADRVSYETTRFGQGLLTRALLTGIKGAALRDGEYVDVARLFQYARDEVPNLAKEIGGIQAPLIAAPRGDSFDVGEMLEADQRAVPLAQVRETMLPGVFQDEDQIADLQKLSTRFNQRLRAENAVAVRGRLAFVDADEFPDAWRVVGRYRQTAQGLKVNARLFRNNELKRSMQLTLRGDENEQVEQLFSAVMQQVTPLSKW